MKHRCSFLVDGLHVCFSVLKHLGCQHGCADGQRGPAAEFLRTQCQNILAKLSRASNKQFKCFLRDYVRSQSIADIMEFFHAYVGFCIDPSSLLSPLSKQTLELFRTLNLLTIQWDLHATIRWVTYFLILIHITLSSAAVLCVLHTI